MSTKIYNGFKIKSLNPKQQKQFVDDVKVKLEPYLIEAFTDVLAEKITDFLDRLSVLDYTKEFDRLETALLSYYRRSNSCIRQFKSAISGIEEKVDVDRIKKSLSMDYYSLLSLFRDICEEDVKRGEITQDIFTSDIDASAEIVMFPITNRNMLLMTYSDKFTSFFSGLCNDKEFVEKYGLIEYHYQNQTDRPERISGREWGKRKHDWDKALPTGIPARDGIVINISDADTFIHTLFTYRAEVIDQVLEKFELRSKRITKIARERAVDRYWQNYIVEHDIKEGNNFHEVMEATREFKEKAKSGDSYVVGLIKEEEELACEYVPDITRDKLCKQSVLSWFPNYKETLSKEE